MKFLGCILTKHYPTVIRSLLSRLCCFQRPYLAFRRDLVNQEQEQNTVGAFIEVLGVINGHKLLPLTLPAMFGLHEYITKLLYTKMINRQMRKQFGLATAYTCLSQHLYFTSRECLNVYSQWQSRTKARRTIILPQCLDQQEAIEGGSNLF